MVESDGEPGRVPKMEPGREVEGEYGVENEVVEEEEEMEDVMEGPAGLEEEEEEETEWLGRLKFHTGIWEKIRRKDW